MRENVVVHLKITLQNTLKDHVIIDIVTNYNTFVENNVFLLCCL